MGRVPVRRTVADPTTREDALEGQAVPCEVNAAVCAKAAAAERAAHEARRRSAFMVPAGAPRRIAPFAPSRKKLRAPHATASYPWPRRSSLPRLEVAALGPRPLAVHPGIRLLRFEPAARTAAKVRGAPLRCTEPHEGLPHRPRSATVETQGPCCTTGGRLVCGSRHGCHGVERPLRCGAHSPLPCTPSGVRRTAAKRHALARLRGGAVVRRPERLRADRPPASCQRLRPEPRSAAARAKQRAAAHRRYWHRERGDC